MFSALAENHGSLRSKLNIFVSMAPIVRLKETQDDFLKSLADDIDSITWWMHLLGVDELFGPNWVLTSAALCIVKPTWCAKAN